MKRTIYPLYASADEGKVKPILETLRKKGLEVQDSKAAPGKGDVLVLFLSANIGADSPVADDFIRLSAARNST